MKILRWLVFFLALVISASAASLEQKIDVEALIVTKAELRRHWAAPEKDAWRPATFADLEKSRGPGQPDYLVLRFRMPVPAHYRGEAEAIIDGNTRGRSHVMLHYNKDWVEYLIPVDGLATRQMERDGTTFRRREGSPPVQVTWLSLVTE